MTWSSRQVISRKDLVSLRKDLLALYMTLQKQHHNTMVTTKIGKDMTPVITTINMLENTLTNLGKELQVK